ncbi:unnamed protein product, partial [Ectocarpus sp. 13 AM-2016]
VVLRQRAFFLSKVREAVQRMALVERRLTEQDNDLTEYRVTRSKAEGAVAALQGRQTEARLSSLEDDISGLKASLGGRTPTQELSEEIAATMKTALTAEMQRSEARLDQIRGVELTTASLERHRTDGEGGETARIRRELQDSEGSLQRRIEEVRASDLRRMEEISGEVVREREHRLKDRAEVEQEVFNVRASLQRTEQYWHERIHDRLNRLERSVESTVSDHSHTRSSVASIGSQLRQLQLEIQNARDTSRRAGQWASDRREEAPSPAIGAHHMPILAQSMQSAARPPQTTASTLADSPKTALEESGKVIPKEQDGARGSPNIIAGEEGVESTTGAMIPAVQACDHQPTHLECSSAVGVCSMPGVVATADATAGQENIEKDDNSADVDNKSYPPRDGDSSPPGSDQRSVGSIVNNGKDSKTPFPFKTGEGTGTPQQNGNLPEPHTLDRLYDRGKVIHASSADTLRKSALAAVSFSAEEDAALAASAGEAYDGRPSQLIRGRSPCSSPSSVSSCGSSAPSSSSPPPSPMSPPHTSSVNSTGAPQADDPGGAETPFAARTPAEALDLNISPPKLLGDGLGASDNEKLADTEAGGSDVSQSRMARSTKTGSSSDSSFSVDDDEAVVGQQRGLGLPETCDNNDSSSRPGVGKTCAPTSSRSTLTMSERGSCDDVSATVGASKYGGRVHHENPRKAPPPRAPPPEMPSEIRRKSMAAVSTGPAPVSFRDRSASKDSGVVTAQCEFCLRRYLKSAMSTHLQVCELRLVRCPFQCGVKVLVRNLEKHMGSCSTKESAEGEGLVNA